MTSRTLRPIPWLLAATLVGAPLVADAQTPLKAQAKKAAAAAARRAAAKPKAPAKPAPPAPKAGRAAAKPGRAAAAVQKAPAAAAETPELEPPGAAEAPPTTMETIAKAVDTPYRPKPGGYRVKFNLEDADLAELVNHISGLTGKRFIYGPKVRQVKVTVVSPTPVTLDEAYEAFLSILAANGMTVVPHGRFQKIVDTGGVVTEGTPVISRAAPVPNTEGFVTRLYRLRNVSPTEVSQLLTKFKSKEGDISTYDPGGLLIITDSGANVNRMVRIIEEVDVGGEDASMWIEPIHYGGAEDIAKQINEIFELGGPGGAGGQGAAGLVRVVADEQTNSLIVVGSEDSYSKLLDLLRRIDSAPAAAGRIHVLQLQHAVADELAQTLTQMLSGTSAGKAGNPAQPGSASGMFEGEVHVTADKATNSLVVTSSSRDFAQLRLVIERLDMARRQVFIEAVIMDVTVARTDQLNVGYHGGTTANLGGGSDTVFFGGFEPLTSVAPSTDQLSGLALGARGPELDGTAGAFGAPAGISIPAFGVILNALATTGDANVLATPHIIATDNVSAEINVGENIPLQTNFAGGSLGNLSSLAGLARGNTNASAGIGALSALGGGLGGFGNAQRQDVGTKIKVTPHINDENRVRLEIEEEISEKGAASGSLGAVSITKRNANTTLIVDDQQTVVIGGLMRDSYENRKKKIPILGDLPVLGFLFRTSETTKRKTNLLLIMTPYVIQDQADLRKVFERKMQERQEFLDRYFVFSSDWEPPKDYSRTNGLVEAIRQSYFAMAERIRLEEETRPREVKEHVMTSALALPGTVKVGGGGSAKSATKRAAPKRATKKRPSRPKSRTKQPARKGGRTDASPIQINPIARSVNVERME